MTDMCNSMYNEEGGILRITYKRSFVKPEITCSRTGEMMSTLLKSTKLKDVQPVSKKVLSS